MTLAFARTRLLRLLAMVALCLGAAGAWSAPFEFRQMQRTQSAELLPPGDAGGDAAWVTVTLPEALEQDGAPGAQRTWYRGEFEGPDHVDPRVQWALCLPFLYEGGEIWVNGALAGSVPESTPELRVRWERPHLVTLPAGLLRPGVNQVAIRTGAVPPGAIHHFPRVLVGLEAEIRPRADRRTFWVRSLPQVTIVVCWLMAGFVLFIYWRRRTEKLYGLLGLACALWGVRTLTFVIERMPADSWFLWRITYLGATGGFIVVMAMFAMRFAGLDKPWAERALLVYWIAGPLWLLWAGPNGEAAVNRVWSAGLIPIGIGILLLAGWAVWRQRTVAAVIMPTTLAVAVLTGMHDYLVAWDNGALSHFLPGWWVGQRIFLLHFGADLVLFGLGGLLTARFLDALSGMERANTSLADLNETLEDRVAQRERFLAENYERMAELQRSNAAAQERELIMREIHDGLGSRLFTSLLRVERGDMTHGQIAQMLRDCIADMRLALEVLAPGDDFQSALGNFLFRWQSLMQDAQVTPGWSVDLPEPAFRLSRQSALQLLRIAQEALTNVLKHAKARNVRVDLRQSGDSLELEVSDDGQGSNAVRHRAGRGIGNMQARARQLGGELDVRSGAGGTRVVLRIPLSRIPSGVEPLLA
ncbi:ATP-binding protein [Xylophilus sp. GOD-11R]|uniref:sensor histidine kinase n=1 Tax=Xylophilus sp. GOD-11R TaxID=3089814 RepID=UPI00298D37DA|nr:ATP-binding protein [Xylophilus sp. GOD-11R]WPB55585.1 7TM diverse intracellular signaling domain-containing protein [Xylophilus sp. GOD-11R]